MAKRSSPSKSSAESKILEVVRSPQFWLAVILLFALAIRLPYLTSPLLDLHSWRQTDTAAIARHYYEDGYRLFYPEIDWNGGGYVECDLPLYSFIVALFYSLFGVHEWIGRLVAILFFLGALFYLYLLVRKFLGERAALLSILVLALFPLTIFFSRAFMPESSMIFFSIAALYYFSEWTDSERWLHFSLATAFLSLAILAKIPTLYLGLPILYLCFRRWEWGLFKKWEIWLFALLALIPPVIWYWHARQIYFQTGNTFGIWEHMGSFSEEAVSFWFNPEFYQMMATRLVGDATIITLLLFVVGIIIKQKDKEARLFYSWTLAVIIYIFLVAKMHYVHNYYQMPLMPPLAVFAGLALSEMAGAGQRMGKKKAGFAPGWFIAIFILLTLAFLSYSEVKNYYELTPEYAEAAQAVKKIASPETKIVVHTQMMPEVFYYAHRQGWKLNPSYEIPDLADALEKYRKKGAQYFVSVFKQDFQMDTRFNSYMFSNYEVVKYEESFIIFDLRKPASQKMPPTVTKVGLNFGDAITLVGYKMPTREAVPNQPFVIIFYWSKPTSTGKLFLPYLVLSQDGRELARGSLGFFGDWCDIFNLPEKRLVKDKINGEFGPQLKGKVGLSVEVFSSEGRPLKAGFTGKSEVSLGDIIIGSSMVE